MYIKQLNKKVNIKKGDVVDCDETAEYVSYLINSKYLNRILSFAGYNPIETVIVFPYNCNDVYISILYHSNFTDEEETEEFVVDLDKNELKKIKKFLLS